MSVDICLCLIDNLTLKFIRVNNFSAHHNSWYCKHPHPLNCFKNMILLLYFKYIIATYSVRIIAVFYSVHSRCCKKKATLTQMLLWSDLREVSRIDNERYWCLITTFKVVFLFLQMHKETLKGRWIQHVFFFFVFWIIIIIIIFKTWIAFSVGLPNLCATQLNLN